MDKKAYIISKKYTDETAIQFGGLKGANAQVKSIVHENGQNIVTFLWRNDSGDERESVMYVEDGTPIYVWESGNTYEYGDLVIYASCFYRCTTKNSDITFDPAHWEELGSPDGNYDIVNNSSELPVRFTAADRKIFYSIEDSFFWLWNGVKWVIMDISTKQDKLTAGDGIKIEKDNVTGKTTIGVKSITSEEYTAMWED